jgi:hypothetical protein
MRNVAFRGRRHTREALRNDSDVPLDALIANQKHVSAVHLVLDQDMH